MFGSLEIKIVQAVALSLLSCSLFAQNMLLIGSSRDTPFAFHQGINTANTNYNSALQFSAFSQPGNQGGNNTGRAIIDFDLSAIPSGSTIQGAFLSLSAIGPHGLGQVASIGHVGQNQCILSLVNSAWDENTITWNNQPTTTNVDSVSIPASTYALQNYLNIDVTTLIQDMVDDPINSHGIMIKLVNEFPSNGLAFYGNLAPEADRRPQLAIAYGECPTVNGLLELSALDRNILLVPNPGLSGNAVRLDLPSMESGSITIELYDQLGRKLRTWNAVQYPFELRLPTISEGSYSLKVETVNGEQLGVAKLVVQ